LLGDADECQTIKDFDDINCASDLKWSFKSQIVKFIKRFWEDPYKDEDRQWIQKLVNENHIKVKSKFVALKKCL
jgi:hypothetical protein